MKKGKSTYLHGRKCNAKDCEEKTSIGKDHLASSRHCRADDEGNKRHVCHHVVSTAIPGSVDDDSEDRTQHPHCLVERHGYHREGHIGQCDV